MSDTQEQTSFILFTDIYRSSALWEQYPLEFKELLHRHNVITEEAAKSNQCEVLKNLGDGYLTVFGQPRQAVECAVSVQREFAKFPPLPDGSKLLLRVAMHAGIPHRLPETNEYFGPILNRCSRICQVCHPGQALVSQAVRAHTGEAVDGAKLTDLGSHHLRDLAEPEHLYQLDHPEFALHEFPPLPTLGYRPNNLAYQPNAFIGREREHGELKALLIGNGRATADEHEESVGAVPFGSEPQGRRHEPPAVGAQHVVPSPGGNGARARHAVPLRKTHRLVTITAPGGYGKSRLATQLCANLLDYYENGVFEVLLAPVGSHERIVGATADALGFQFYGKAEPQQQLIDYLREKNMLISFDNFEHVMEGKNLLVDILQHAPKVNLLVTSREPLRLKAEKVYKLEPLPISVGRAPVARRPESGKERRGTGPRPTGEEIITGETLRRLRRGGQAPAPPTEVPTLHEELPEAVQLFIDRATLVKHDFALTPENLATVNDICTKLNGIPLSIELAAAWADSFTLGELLSEVEQQLDLTAKMSDVPERQRSIRASLDWSYNLLNDEQREVVRAVSTFKGGFFFEAAESVVGAQHVVPAQSNDGARARHAVPLREILSQLSDKGWLFTREVLEKTRFFIRDAATHQYAWEKLKESAAGAVHEPPPVGRPPVGRRPDSGEERPGTLLRPALRDFGGQAGPRPTEYEQRTLAHAAYFAKLIEREGERLEGHGQLEALRILGVELENIYEGLDTCLKRVGAVHEPPRAIHELPLHIFAKHLGSYLDMVSRWQEGLSWYERVGEACQKLDDPALRVCVFLGSARFLWRLSRYEEAEKAASAARKLAEDTGDRKSLAQALRYLGDTRGQERYKEAEKLYAEKLYQESLNIEREIGSQFGIAISLHRLGVFASRHGRYEEPEKLWQESLEIRREIGDLYGIADSLNSLGVVAHGRGRYEETEKLYQDSLEIKREIGDRYGVARSLHNLGVVARAQGRYEEAEKLFQESMQIFREIGDRDAIGSCLNNLGKDALRQQKYEDAEKLYKESLEIGREIGSRGWIALSLNNLGLVAHAQGRHEKAEKLYQESLQISREIGSRYGIAFSLNNLGALSIKVERFPDAYEYLKEALQEALQVSKEFSFPDLNVEGLITSGYLLVMTGHWKEAALLLTGAERQAKEAMNFKLEPMEQGELDEGMAKIRKALSEEELAEAKSRAEEMSLEELTEFALETLSRLDL